MFARCGPMLFLCSLSALVAMPARACRVPPASQLISPEAQVAMAGDVTLATVTGVTPTADGATSYQFVVQRRLSGVGDTTFSVAGAGVSMRDLPGSGDGHADPVFWQRGGGRVMNDTDCEIHPSFEVGATYLIFSGRAPTRRSFERIDMRDDGASDRWLAFVAERLRDRQAP